MDFILFYLNLLNKERKKAMIRLLLSWLDLEEQEKLERD